VHLVFFGFFFGIVTILTRGSLSIVTAFVRVIEGTVYQRGVPNGTCMRHYGGQLQRVVQGNELQRASTDHATCTVPTGPYQSFHGTSARDAGLFGGLCATT